ncbi:MAG: hypothetical protein HFK04_06010 [Oscillospiraceae bacterium]|nr:hypothetical protein [Oscillospiraceae bacterium]
MKGKRRGETGSIKVIGGASGPTAVFAVSRKEIKKRRAEQEAFLERAQRLAVPCEKTFEETIWYLCKAYRVQPTTLSKGQRQSAKMNILLNQHPELVGYEPFPENPSEEQLAEYSRRQDEVLERAALYPEEELGLVIEGYRIPEKQAQALREQEQKERPPAGRGRLSRLIAGWAGWWRGESAVMEQEERPLVVVLEKTHAYMTFDGPGGGALADDLARFRGISEEDIRTRSPRFVGYAYLMKKDGLWK